MKKQTGFTLVELMVTLAVFGILAVTAVPAFNSYIKSNRLVSDTNTFVGTLNYARNEAIKRRVDISVCRSSDGTTCATGGGSWDAGWIVFVNSTGATPAQVNAGDTVLRNAGALTDDLKASAAMADYITFSSNGYSSATGQFVLCDHDGTTSTARVISVTLIGRITLAPPGGGTCTPV